jgi:hypothetical protein
VENLQWLRTLAGTKGSSSLVELSADWTLRNHSQDPQDGNFVAMAAGHLTDEAELVGRSKSFGELFAPPLITASATMEEAKSRRRTLDEAMDKISTLDEVSSGGEGEGWVEDGGRGRGRRKSLDRVSSEHYGGSTWV